MLISDLQHRVGLKYHYACICICGRMNECVCTCVERLSANIQYFLKNSKIQISARLVKVSKYSIRNILALYHMN